MLGEGSRNVIKHKETTSKLLSDEGQENDPERRLILLISHVSRPGGDSQVLPGY